MNIEQTPDIDPESAAGLFGMEIATKAKHVVDELRQHGLIDDDLEVALEKYIGVKSLEPFINKDLVLERLVPFRLPDVEGLDKAVKGLPADLMIEVCQGFVAALQASLNPNSPYPKLTDRQRQMAIQANRG